MLSTETQYSGTLSCAILTLCKTFRLPPPRSPDLILSSRSFAFGNKTQPPYIQLLSQTQRGRAARDFARVRSNLLDDSPPELSPRDVINLFDFPTPEESGRKTSGKASVDLADDASSSSGTDSQVAKYGPMIVGLLGANLVVLIVLVCLALLNCVRTGRSEGPSRALGVKYAPVKLKETESSRFSADGRDRLYSQ